TVVLGRVMYGSAGFLSNRARHQVCGDLGSGASAGGARAASRIVRITERTTERTPRVGRSHFSEIRLGQDNRARLAQALDKGSIVRRPIVRVGGIHASSRAHIEGVVLVLDG